MQKIDYTKIIENDFELSLYKRLHQKILAYLQQEGPTTFWQIIRTLGGSDRRTLRLLNQMLKKKEIHLSNGIISTKQKSATQQRARACSACNAKLIPLNGVFETIKEQMAEIYKAKPAPTFLFDQRPVTLTTTIQRAAYLSWRGDLINKEIVLVGDDDLTSIALALTRKAKRIIVFDIDQRLIKYINHTAQKHNLKLEAYQYDLSKELPIQFKNKFDIFLTDPTPKRNAFALFVSIGLMLLKEGSSHAGYVSFFPSHQEKTLDFQQVLTERSVMITDMIPHFTEYAFLETTYRPEDLTLLESFDSVEERLSFHENFTRFETTEETLRHIEKITNKADILGKATHRVLSDIKKDPAYIQGDKQFVTQIAQQFRKKK